MMIRIEKIGNKHDNSKSKKGLLFFCLSKSGKEGTWKKSEDTVLPDVNAGDVLSIENKEIKEKFTQPPKHFTEDTLLKSMEVAGNEALEKGVEVERKGLGTPATMAGIIVLVKTKLIK